MEAIDYFEDEPCDRCGTTEYYIDNGVRICRHGHEQGEGQIIGEDEDDYGAHGKLVRKKVEKTKKRVSRIYRGAKAYRLFLQAYQYVLWRQCYALIHDKSLPADLWTIVRDLWALRLSKLLHRLGEGSSFDAGSSGFSSTEESGYEGLRKSTKSERRRKDSPKLAESVALCYMGILLLRLPVGMGDLYRWIKEEDILYIRAIQGVPLEMREKLPGEYHHVLDTTVLPQASDLHMAISELALMYRSTFGLALPPINHEPLLYRYITRLAIPLEIFPAVQRLAEMTHAKFHYHDKLRQEGRRKQSHSFPELQLMALVIVAVKLLFPFEEEDDYNSDSDSPHTRHPRSIHEPAAQIFDWKTWTPPDALSEQPPSDGNSPSLPRGTAIDLHAMYVFSLTPHQLDAYMDWYQKTWVREPPASTDDHVSKEILDMFPLSNIHPSMTDHHNTGLQREKQLHGQNIKIARASTTTLRFRRPVSDEEAAERGMEDVKRPGQDYVTFKMEDGLLPGLAGGFFAAAAEVAGTSVKNLRLAVSQVEAKIGRWKSAKRRAEVMGEEFVWAENVMGNEGGEEGGEEGEEEELVGKDVEPEHSMG